MSGAPKQVWPPKGDRRTVDEICIWLGVTRHWVLPRIAKGKWPHEMRSNPKQPTRGFKTYSMECQMDLKRQRDRQLKHPPLGNWYTVDRAASELGCNDEWILRRMGRQEYGLPKLAKRRNAKGRVVDALSPRSLAKLRRLRGQAAPFDFGTAADVSRLSGRHRKTVRRRLRRSSLAPGSFLAATGKSYPHYDLEAAVALVETDRYPPAGAWLTASRMANMLGRDYRWVAARLRRPRYDQLKQKRLDDVSRPRWHWPPPVFNELKLESNSLWDPAPCARGPSSVIMLI